MFLSIIWLVASTLLSSDLILQPFTFANTFTTDIIQSKHFPFFNKNALPLTSLNHSF